MANEKLYHVKAIERTETRHFAEVYAEGDAEVRKKIIDGDIMFNEPNVLRGDIEFEIREVHISSAQEPPEKTGNYQGPRVSVWECCDG